MKTKLIKSKKEKAKLSKMLAKKQILDALLGKDKLISRLVEDEFEFIKEQLSGDEYLEQMLLTGFKGYNNMSLEEIQQEIDAREL